MSEVFSGYGYDVKIISKPSPEDCLQCKNAALVTMGKRAVNLPVE